MSPDEIAEKLEGLSNWLYNNGQSRDSALMRVVVTKLTEGAARIAELEDVIVRTANAARPYKDESGIIEIPLHSFGSLHRTAGEIIKARRALAGGGM